MIETKQHTDEITLEDFQHLQSSLDFTDLFKVLKGVMSIHLMLNPDGACVFHRENTPNRLIIDLLERK